MDMITPLVIDRQLGVNSLGRVRALGNIELRDVAVLATSLADGVDARVEGSGRSYDAGIA